DTGEPPPTFFEGGRVGQLPERCGGREEGKLPVGIQAAATDAHAETSLVRVVALPDQRSHLYYEVVTAPCAAAGRSGQAGGPGADDNHVGSAGHGHRCHAPNLSAHGSGGAEMVVYRCAPGESSPQGRFRRSTGR